MRVTVLHPDLGIGGAERLIVDAALALQTKGDLSSPLACAAAHYAVVEPKSDIIYSGHTVKVVTNQFDASHAFTECSQLG